MIMRGSAADKAVKAIAERFSVSKSQAGRLVMTESAAFANEARKDCFNDLGVEQYVIVEALDNETCALCGQLDGKVYPMSEYAIGVTAPPFHPWCRGTTVPYYEELKGIGDRYARDAKTGERFTIPKDMTYEDWRKMQDELHGAGAVEKYRKMRYNEKIDKQQWQNYVDRLGSNAPATFKDFQRLKYGDEWSIFKAYARSIKSGELTPLADFTLYQETSADINKLLIGKITKNNLTITGKSDHFIARTIGSVEQRRNGVPAKDSLRTLTAPVIIDPVKTDKDGRRSQRFIADGMAVTINPDTGTLIQVNPLKKRKAKEVAK